MMHGREGEEEDELEDDGREKRTEDRMRRGRGG